MSDSQVSPLNSTIQLKVSLVGIEPAIWRRVLVPSSITLPILHWTFQELMGWANYHEHSFLIAGRRYGVSSDGAVNDGELDEYDVKLVTLIDVGATFTYEYDFGDDWLHEVEVEATQPTDGPLRHPSCFEGARACPPEDVGGPSRYQSFLKVLADTSHEDHHAMTEWSGGEFDPEHFDIELVNVKLQRVH